MPKIHSINDFDVEIESVESHLQEWSQESVQGQEYLQGQKESQERERLQRVWSSSIAQELASIAVADVRPHSKFQLPVHPDKVFYSDQVKEHKNLVFVQPVNLG